MVRQSIKSAITAFVVIVFYAGTVMGHGRVAPEEDNCVRKIGNNMLHLSAYQPQYDQKGEYCTEIPVAGDIYLVVDLIDEALRNMPVGLKVFRGSEIDGETVAQVSANYHPDGVINGVSRLEKGLYSLVVTAEGVPPLNYYYQLRVEMVDYAKEARVWIAYALVTLFLVWLTYKLVQSGRLRTLFNFRH